MLYPTYYIIYKKGNKLMAKKYAMFCICNEECQSFNTYNSFYEAEEAMRKAYQQALGDEHYNDYDAEWDDEADKYWIHSADHIHWYIKPLF